MACMLAIACMLDPATGDALTSSATFKVFDKEAMNGQTDAEVVKGMKVGKLRVAMQFPRNSWSFTYIYFGKDGVTCI